MTPQLHTPEPTDLAATGIPGLDVIIQGGFPRDRLYLLDGEPGTGKTTLAMQFLIAGARRGETVLYITLSETESELHAIARSHGFDLTGITIHQLNTSDSTLRKEDQYTVFHPSEVELGETTAAIIAVIDQIRPARIVFDSLSEMRLLARDPLRYRRQILGLKQLLIGQGAAVILLDDLTASDNDLQVASIVNGVVRLEQSAPEYGVARRRLRVTKLRGVPFHGGYHDLRIATGGLVVYPRMLPRTGAAPEQRRFNSELPALDTLLGGGLDWGTTSLFLGPAGVGKSALGAQFALTAATRGDGVVVYLFDESRETYRWRQQGIGTNLEPFIDNGTIALETVDPASLTPGEFIHRVKSAVDDGARVIILDSLTGYLHAMPDEHLLVLQLHELFMFLRHRGVLTIVILAQQGLIGTMQSPVDLSYMADTVLLMRYFEAQGEIRQAISVMKKRSGAHERTIREFKLDHTGIRIGEPLTDFTGVLTGVPSYTGADSPLLGRRR